MFEAFFFDSSGPHLHFFHNRVNAFAATRLNPTFSTGNNRQLPITQINDALGIFQDSWNVGGDKGSLAP